MHFNMSPAILFSLDQSKILSAGNGLIVQTFNIVRRQMSVCLKLKELTDNSFRRIEKLDDSISIRLKKKLRGKRKNC